MCRNVLRAVSVLDEYCCYITEFMDGFLMEDYDVLVGEHGIKTVMIPCSDDGKVIGYYLRFFGATRGYIEMMDDIIKDFKMNLDLCYGEKMGCYSLEMEDELRRFIGQRIVFDD